jgi:hypothetical protein
MQSRMKGWLLSLLLMGGGGALACTLQVQVAEPLVGVVSALEAVEPMWPRERVVRDRNIPLPDGHPARDAVRFLLERQLLPDGAALDPVAPEVWSALLRSLTDGVRQPPLATGGPDDAAAVAADLGALLQVYAAAVRPLALIARATEPPHALSFLGLVWNYSPYPRLMVFRPSDAQRQQSDPLALAQSLGTCAFTVNHYVSAPEPEARALFLSHPDVRMFVVASQPDMRGRWPFEVERGDEARVFAFDHPMVNDLDAFSAVFVGDAAPVMTLLRLLPSLRTNVSPLALPAFLMTP